MFVRSSNEINFTTDISLLLSTMCMYTQSRGNLTHEYFQIIGFGKRKNVFVINTKLSIFRMSND